MSTKEIANLLVRVGADISNLEKQLGKAQRMMTSWGNTAKAAGQSMTAGITAPLIAAGGAATKLAMDAIESENLFQVAMGGMADSARKWSEGLRKELGLNSYELRKQVGTYYTMFESMKLPTKAAYEMATGLTKLAYDMASFYNLKPEEAFEKLSAGITGETEPLKRLGILVNEETVKQYAYASGIAKAGAQLTEQQKVLARYAAIMDQTKKAQGDMARTLDSPTNQLRILKSELSQTATELGMELIPVMTDFLKASKPLIEGLKDAVKWFSALDESTRRKFINFALLAAAIGPVTWGIGSMAGAVGNIIGLMRTARGVVTAVGGALTTLGKAAGGANGGMITLGKTMIKNIGVGIKQALILAAIAAVAYLVARNWDTTAKQNEAAMDLMGAAAELAKARIVKSFEDARAGLAIVFNWMATAAARMIENLGRSFDGIDWVPGIDGLSTKLKNTAAELRDGASAYAEDAKAGAAAASAAYEDAMANMRQTGTAFGEAFKKAQLTSPIDRIKQDVETLKAFFNGDWLGGNEAWVDDLRKLEDGYGGAADAVSSLQTSLEALQQTTGTGQGGILTAISDAGLVAARRAWEGARAIGNAMAQQTALAIMEAAGGAPAPAYALPGASAMTAPPAASVQRVEHSGTITVRGVNSQGELVGVVEHVIGDGMLKDQDRYSTIRSNRRIFRG